MGKDSAPSANPNTTQTQLTDPAKLPYYTKLWDDTMKQYTARQTPTANPFSIGDTTPLGGGNLSSWTDRNGKAMNVASTGPIDWSKYFGTAVNNPYAPAYLATNPTAQYQYQGATGTATAPGTAANPTPAAAPTAPTAPAATTPTTTGSATADLGGYGGVRNIIAMIQAGNGTTPAVATPVAAKAGGYINAYAPGGIVGFDDGGGVEDPNAQPAEDTTAAAPADATPASSGYQLGQYNMSDQNLANAKTLFQSNDDAAIAAAQKQYNLSNGEMAQLYSKTMGGDAGQVENKIDTYYANQKTPTANAANTANQLSAFDAPSGVTNPYQKTTYTAQDYTPEQIAAQQNTANQMDKPADAVAASMTPVSNVDKTGVADVSTDKFTDPGNVDSYMNPYQKAATDVTISEMQRSFDKTKNVRDAQASQAGAFGGYRQGIENSEAQRNESQLESNTRATDANAAYQQALAAYNADQSRSLTAQQTNTGQNLQAALANQGAETTTKVQNLTADQQTRLANLGMATTVGQANLTAAQQTALANQATNLSAQQSNQQAGLTANSQNNQNNQAAANIAQTSEAQNAQYGIQSQLANIDNTYRAAGVNLTGGQLNSQLAQQGQTSDIATMQNETQQRAQDLNMSQFQTQTTQSTLAALQTQYGAIQNWPLDQLKAALAALKTT